MWSTCVFRFCRHCLQNLVAVAFRADHPCDRTAIVDAYEGTSCAVSVSVPEARSPGRQALQRRNVRRGVSCRAGSRWSCEVNSAK